MAEGQGNWLHFPEWSHFIQRVCVCVCTPSFLLYCYYDVDSSTDIVCPSLIPHVENRAYPKSQWIKDDGATELTSIAAFHRRS